MNAMQFLSIKNLWRKCHLQCHLQFSQKKILCNALLKIIWLWSSSSLWMNSYRIVQSIYDWNAAHALLRERSLIDLVWLRVISFVLCSSHYGLLITRLLQRFCLKYHPCGFLGKGPRDLRSLSQILDLSHYVFEWHCTSAVYRLTHAIYI